MKVITRLVRLARSAALLVFASMVLMACGGSGKPSANPSASIVATERGETPISAPSPSPSPSAPAESDQTWTGTAHLSYAVPLREPCRGTADFNLDVVVGAGGTISGTGTGGYSPYTCHTNVGDITEPGASAHYKLTGSEEDGHLLFFMAPDPLGRGLPPAWPSEPIGSFDVPITGKEASVEVQSFRSGGRVPGRLKLTVFLTCSTCQ